MTPHLFYVDSADLSTDTTSITVAGAEGHHGVAVKRLRVGEVVLASNGEGLVASGSVVKVIGRGQFVIEVDSVDEVARPTPRIAVAQALIKSDRLELAADSMTEAGVDEIAVWVADRSVVKPSATARINERLNRHTWEASKQSRRAWRPSLVFDRTFSGLLEMVDAADRTYLLDEQAPESFSEAAIPGSITAKSLLLIVGPEGGLSDSERDQLAAHGAVAVRMGDAVMRAGTAGTVALGWLMGATGRWSSANSDISGTLSK